MRIEVVEGDITEQPRSRSVAGELGAATIAFPLISAGAYGWPLEDAVAQALAVLRSVETELVEARPVLFGAAAFAAAQRASAERA